LRLRSDAICKDSMKMKFAIISDIHFGPAKFDTPETHAIASLLPEIVGKIVSQINEQDDLEFIIHLGDLVQENRNNPSREEDLRSGAQVLEILRQVKVPLYHVVGNHDRVTLEMADLIAMFGRNLFYSFESSCFTNIVLQCESPRHVNVHLVDQEMEWLSDQLSKSKKPVLVFMHQLLVEHPLEGTSCEGMPDCAYVRNKEEIRDLLESSKKVKAVFNGHMHRNLSRVENSIPYISVQAMTEVLAGGLTTAEAYAIVEIDESQLSVDVRGNDAIRYVHKW